MGVWSLITNLILFFDYDVIFFCFMSKTTCVRMVEVAPNDAEYMISYLSSIHYLVVSPSEKELIQKSIFLSVFLTNL